MDKSGVRASIAEAGEEIGGIACRHLETVFRDLLAGPDVVREGAFLRLVTGEAHPFGNLAIVSAPGGLEATRAAIEPLAGLAAPSAVLFPAAEVDDETAAFLADRGFGSHGSMPAMAVDIDRLAPTSLPAGYRFERVTTEDEGEEWAARFAIGYELPVPVARLFSPALIEVDPASDAPVQFFVVRKGDAIVGTSVLYLADGVAGVYCVATVPEERGKGLGAHATAEPLRLAHGLGYRVGVLQSSEMGHGVYRRLGFEDVGGVPIYVRVPGA